MQDQTPSEQIMALAKPRVWRAYDARHLNEVVNHPSVLPWVTMEWAPPKFPIDGSGELNELELDLAPLVADLRNVVLCVEGGALFFHWQEPGLYEVHIQFIEGPARAMAVGTVRAGLHWMFTRTDAMELVTKVPVCNRGASAIVRSIRGELLFERERAWATPEGEPCGVMYYGLRCETWIWRTHNELVAKGQWFHARLDEERARLGTRAAPHGDDPAHDRAVGATVDMILGGQLDKGLVLYNRWARLAGYQPITIESLVPCVLVLGPERVLVDFGERTFFLLP
jgi:hypothetical protein